MAISLANFGERDDTQRVLKKAREDRPFIRKRAFYQDPHGWYSHTAYTCCGRTLNRTSGRRWRVTITVDMDGAEHAVCECPAGTPPIDARTGLTRYEPRACYHVAAVYLNRLAVSKRLATVSARRIAADRSPRPESPPKLRLVVSN